MHHTQTAEVCMGWLASQISPVGIVQLGRLQEANQVRSQRSALTTL